MTKQDLLALPEIVSGFNGFYAKRGVYVLMNQNRILILLGVGAVVLLVAITSNLPGPLALVAFAGSSEMSVVLRD